MMTTKQKLEADPHMGYLIDELPDWVIWRALPTGTEECPMVEVIPVITGVFRDPA